MKYKIVLPMLAAIVIFAATTNAEAGIFGRLSVVWNGCNPCEQAAACNPCEPITCNPCESIFDNGCFDACGPNVRPFRPLNGVLTNLRARLASARCAPADCNPCEAVCVAPCESACDPCDPISVSCNPRSPFAGLFQNLRSRMASARCATADCNPCGPIVEPCGACR